ENVSGSRRAFELWTLTQSVAELSPEFEALAMFARSLGSAAAAAEAAEPGRIPSMDAATQAELLAAAEKLASGRPHTAIRSGALLGVVAVLSQERDVRPLYRLLDGP